MNTQNTDQKRGRKISFKIKNGSQKKILNTTSISVNKVKQLTDKYNQLLSKNEPEIRKIVKRVNSKFEKFEKPKIRPKPKIELRKKSSIRKLDQKTIEKRHSVQETIAIFEEKTNATAKLEQKSDKKTSDLYETLKITKTTSSEQVLKMATENKMAAVPNNSFLWRQKHLSLNIYSSIVYDDNDDQYEDTGQKSDLSENFNIYDVVEPKTIDEEIIKYEKIIKKADSIINNFKSAENDDIQCKISSTNDDISHSYEILDENFDTNAQENIYETLYPKTEPYDAVLTENIYSTINEHENHDSKSDIDGQNSTENELLPTYETIDNIKETISTNDSILSYDKTNSIYGKYSPTSISTDSSNFEDWVDLSDQEFENSQFYLVRDKQKVQKKNSGWSNKVREQYKKNLENDAISDTYHYYESLNSDQFDSFDSDSDYDSKTHPNDSGVEMGMANLPEIPKMGSQHGFNKLAQRLRKNWSLTKNDISKSLSRMTKKSPQKNLQLSTPMSRPRAVSSPVLQKIEPENDQKTNISNSLSRKKNWLKFRRAQSLAENPETDHQILQVFNPNITKSTFYLDQKPEVPVRKKMLRPQSPPPPIPSKGRNTNWYLDERVYTQKTKDINTKTSWYTDDDDKKLQKPDLIPNSVFYTNAEQTNDDTDIYYNTKNEKFSTLLKDEPLYQFYDAEYTENCLSISSSDSDYDGYETVGSTEIPQRNSLRNILKSGRTLWCEVPEVIRSQVLPSMSQTKKKLQEAKFEILTSETSYFNSLSILTDHFIPKICQQNFLTPPDQKILFGNIDSVKKVSENLLNDLEVSWNDSIFLTDVCTIIKKYSDNYFNCYVDYCANQGLADNILRKLKTENVPKNGKSPQMSRFGQTIKELESNSNCQGLSLHSFLMLPMQRVTRLPLLLDAVLRRLSHDDDEYSSCLGALRSLQDLVAKCNEAARQTERLIELEKLKKIIEFPLGMNKVDLLEHSPKRFLVKSGDLVQLLAKSSEDGLKLTFGKRFQKISLTIFLFTDWIIIAKKKSDDTFNVLHHCPRNFLEVSPPESQQLTLNNALLLFLTLLENQDGKQVSFMLTCANETERERWFEALCPTKTENPNEVIYESWDCPQVQVIHNYEAKQPDELNLKRGDIVNVDRKMTDSWFHGEKIFDSQKGWFPANFVTEISNPHVRARNLRQRYRLLALTNEFLNNSQQK